MKLAHAEGLKRWLHADHRRDPPGRPSGLPHLDPQHPSAFQTSAIATAYAADLATILEGPCELNSGLRLLYRRHPRPRTRARLIFFIELATRQILQVSVTEHPDGDWVTQQARNLCWSLETVGVRPTIFLRDLDSKFSTRFDAVFASEGIATVRTPYRTPQANGHVERWVGSARRECLDWLLIVNRDHLERVLDE